MNSDAINQSRLSLFEELRSSNVTFRNRVVMAPMVTNFATADNEITDRQVSYYAERARGGVGTVIVEAAVIHPSVRAFERQVGVYDKRLIPGLSRLASAIRQEGAVALIQLHHAGPKIKTELGLQPVSASSVQIRQGDMPRQLSIMELDQIRKDFTAAARLVFQAGFNGVELHAAHLYLLSAFISPYTNRRDDAYGGDITSRTRLVREIIEDIKESVGSDFLLWVRINGCEALNPGLSVEESAQAAAMLSEAGADAIHVSAYTIAIDSKVKTGLTIPVVGLWPQLSSEQFIDSKVKTGLTIPVGSGPCRDTPSGPFLDYAKAIKQAVGIPVVAVGKLDAPAVASEAMTEGKCDMIALGRQLLCDPYWAEKVKDAREGQIVHCNYCNTCHKALHEGKEILCAQNLNLYGKPKYKRPSVGEDGDGKM
ncbi:MAG: NADH:flavin oxidoreductase [Deltaproteobacteria bacterium]|nr:NADH:flavin oxidoreductase [Deltaproteobacteria bacterium]MBW2153706.1 NADH:flavin oxidoreductase [Deltaproteobacteria bacterium]